MRWLTILMVLGSCTSTPSPPDGSREIVYRGTGRQHLDSSPGDRLGGEPGVETLDPNEAIQTGETATEKSPPQPDASRWADTESPDQSLGLAEVGLDVGDEVIELSPEVGPEAGREVIAEVGREVGADTRLACSAACFVGCNIGCGADGQCQACATCTCDVVSGSCHC